MLPQSANDNLLELFQIDEQGDGDELAMRFGVQGQIEDAFA